MLATMKPQLQIKTADGVAPAWLFQPQQKPPAGNSLPGALFFMDAMGPRASMFTMAQKLADAGYVVLLPDLFYRWGHYGPFDGKAFENEESKKLIMSMMSRTTAEMTAKDSAAFLDSLSKNGAKGMAGVVGYCMGGARAMHAAATHPTRIGAVASFHGGRLASDAPDSPHLVAKAIKARLYVGGAGVDGSFPPEQSAKLAQALRTAEVDHIIENYVGCPNGWTVPDSSAYNTKGAERHWKRLLTFFE